MLVSWTATLVAQWFWLHKWWISMGKPITRDPPIGILRQRNDLTMYVNLISSITWNLKLFVPSHISSQGECHSFNQKVPTSHAQALCIALVWTMSVTTPLICGGERDVWLTHMWSFTMNEHNTWKQHNLLSKMCGQHPQYSHTHPRHVCNTLRMPSILKGALFGSSVICMVSHPYQKSRFRPNNYWGGFHSLT